jgi:hypothetical protein
MTSLLHFMLAVGLLPSRHDLPTSLGSGLIVVGCFALLLGLGYTILGPMWVRRHTHMHR